MGMIVQDLDTATAPRTVSIEEAARMLGIGRTTAYQLARAGAFPARIFKIGSGWKVSRHSLELLIDGDAEQPS